MNKRRQKAPPPPPLSTTTIVTHMHDHFAKTTNSAVAGTHEMKMRVQQTAPSKAIGAMTKVDATRDEAYTENTELSKSYQLKNNVSR